MAYRLDIKRILSMNFFHDLPQIMLGVCLGRHRDRLVFDSQRSCRRWRYGPCHHYPSGRRGARPIASRWYSDDRDERLAVVGRYARGRHVLRGADRDGLCAAGLLYRSVRPVCSTSGGCGPDAPLPCGAALLRASVTAWCCAPAPTPAAPDTIGQIISRNTSLPVGSTVMAIDVAVCVLSAPVFFNRKRTICRPFDGH